jgi:hypothetical protein
LDSCNGGPFASTGRNFCHQSRYEANEATEHAASPDVVPQSAGHDNPLPAGVAYLAKLCVICRCTEIDCDLVLRLRFLLNPNSGTLIYIDAKVSSISYHSVVHVLPGSFWTSYRHPAAPLHSLSSTLSSHENATESSDALSMHNGLALIM